LNASRTVSSASRAIRISLFLCLLAFLAALTPLAASAAPRMGQDGLGQVLALMASLHTSQVRAAAPGVSANGGLQRTPDGRVLLPHGLLRPGALRAGAASGSNTVPIPGAVQTFDVNNPPPAFQPLVGFRNPDGTIGNNPANPPYFQKANTLAPTNLTPVWSADETFIVFSSNRTEDGNIQADGRFHLWAISVNGGEAYQITTSSTGTGEFFPTLSANDGKLAFISDAQSPGTQNLYVLNQFSFSILVGLNNNSQQFLNVSQPDPSKGGIVSMTMRGANPDGSGTPATGFDQVQRPTFSPNNDSELVFSARSVTGTYAGHYHLYFLFTTSGGFDPNNVSLPGKLTDGPADDTDPAWSKDGQFIAFASTAASVTNNPQNSFGPNPPNVNGTPVVQDPNQSQSLTNTPDPNGLRSIFLLGGGTRGLGFGVVPTRLAAQAMNGRVGAITAAGTDNFGPAWSFNTRNQFLNPTPGFEYLAFARGASPTAPHDIYYLQTARIIDPVGESQRSSEIATTPDPFLTPLYQINAGKLDNATGPPVLPYVNDEFFNGASAPPGGVETQPGPFDTSGDPIAPPGIYSTDRSDTTFSYDIPNLTPGAQYTLILHFLDPTSTATGARLFNLTVNGRRLAVVINGQQTPNIDIFALAGAQNKAVLLRSSVTAPYGPSVVDAQGRPGYVDTQGDTIQTGHIFLRFTQVNPAKGNPIVQGVDVYSSTASGGGTQASPSSGFGILVSTGTDTAPADIRAIGDVVNGQPQITLTAAQPNNNNNLGRPVAYNVYRSPGGPTSDNTPNNSGGGNEGIVPYAANVAPNGSGGLTFVDTNVQTGSEYFYQVTAVYQEAITAEGIAEPNGSPNRVIKLNTDDNAGQTSADGNSYDDVYPAWSPFRSIFSITYASNRTVTYNTPANSFPTETAVSVGRGGTVNTSDPNQPSYTVGGGYTGIFESQVLNLDPPTLLRFSPNEIVHVQAGGSANPVTGTPTKFQGLNPGRPVTFTVRMSDREAGIDNTGAFSNGPSGAQVYLQIKNPNSKYQDAQALEHKVFSKDRFFNGQANRVTLNDLNSGTANRYLGLGFDAFEGIFNVPNDQGIFTYNLPINKFSYPPYGTPDQGAPATNNISGRGVHGGHWPFPNANNPDNTFIYIGRNGGGVNSAAPFVDSGLSGGDPSKFIPTGPEYECQLVNPQFMSSGQPNGPTDPSPADYTDPYWLAGVDDQGPFSGQGRVRPTANGAKQDGTLAPAEWLQMTRVPDAQQDNKGGVLYTITWTTPASASDFYLDVIAFDQAVFPNIPQGTSRFGGGQVNWRIYDNVGGFSTVQSLPNNDILVVSDYALGQKFAATSFAGTNNNLNLVPKLFGTESYLTDVDVSTLPDSVYCGLAIATISPGPPPTIVPPFTFVPAVLPNFFVPVLNALGVGSFNDRVIDDLGRRDGNPDVGSQRYAIWRILSRGPVPDAVLNSYLPSRQTQPAIADTLSPDAAYRSIPAGDVLDAHRCVVWMSPYTGDLLTDPGSLGDPGTPAQNGATVRLSTQTVLRNFVLGDGTAAHPGGGRLFITGQDIGATLTLGGSVSNSAGGFLPDVLNATLATPGGGTRALTATANRITGNPNYDGSAPSEAYPNPLGTVQGTFVTGTNIFRIPPGGGQYPYLDTLALGSDDHNDASLDQIPSRQLTLPNPTRPGASIQGQIDTIKPVNGANLAASYDNGQGAIVFHDDPLRTDASAKPGQPNGGAGSRVVYAAFGLEALSTDYVSSDAPDPAKPNHVPPVLPHNARQQILHNIVCYLRTGSVSGIITQTAGTGQGAGQGVSGVTVYLKPFNGAAPPTRAAFSAATSGDGRFTISGVEPGTYSLVAYKPGFTRAVSNAGVGFTVEGDVNLRGATLTVAPLPPGQIAGSIKDANGNPVVGATATFTSQDKTVVKTATTRDGSQPNQPAGSYFVDNVPVTNYTAVADGPLNDQGKPEYAEAAAPDKPFDTGVTVQANTTTQPVNFTLTPILATISGRIFNTKVGDTAAGGASVAGATVNLLDGAGKPVNDSAGKPITTTAAADGTYTFTNVPATSTATTYTITASKTGFGMGGAPVSVTVLLGDVITGKDIGLTPLASISGRIFDTTIGDTDAGGKSAGGATVTLTDSAGKTVATISTNPASADAGNGTYTFTGVPPGTYTITATKVGFATTNNTKTVTVTLGSVLTSPATDIGLSPIPPGSITGQVTDASGAGVAGALVTFVSADGTVTLHATADANGNYTIASVFPGIYKGTATGPLNPNGRPTTTAGTGTVTVASAPAVTTANFSVATIPPSLAGTVTDKATGKSLASALVTITDTATGAVIKTIKTDAGGNYSTGPLPASGNPLSQYTVTITASLVGYATQSLPSQSIYNGDALTGQNIALISVQPGSVSGQVTDLSSGAGVAGAAVIFTSTDGTTTLGPATTDANGNYSIPPPPGKTDPAGNYIGSVTSLLNANGKPEFSTAAPQAVTIPPGGTQTVNFVLTEIPASLSGTVLDNQTGKPISGATVTITDSTGKTVGTTKTGADGTYSLTAIPAGQTAASFNVSVTAPGGYFPGVLTPAPSLSLGDRLTGQNIGLDEQGIITGLVTDASTGQPLPNVALTVTDIKTGATPANLAPSPLVTTPGTFVGLDGKTSNYVATFVLTPGDTYSVSASKPSFNPSAAVAVTPAPLALGQVGRADLKLTSSIGILGGLVSDATTNTAVGGATVTVTSTVAGVSTVVATFTTNGSVSSAPDGKTLNYSGPVAQGTYTVTLTFGNRAPVSQKVTVAGGQFNRLDFIGANGTPPVYTFPAGLQFVSTPYDYSALGFDGLFGILNTAPSGTTPNGNRTHVAVWDPTVPRYALDPDAPADSLRLGVGYWVFIKNAVPVTVQGGTPSAPFVPVALHPAWNQIGVPNIKGVPVSNLMFDNGTGGMISFATAASSQYHVVSPTLYSYDGSGYQPVTQSSVLQPWKAYWIKVFSNATIEIPTR